MTPSPPPPPPLYSPMMYKSPYHVVYQENHKEIVVTTPCMMRITIFIHVTKVALVLCAKFKTVTGHANKIFMTSHANCSCIIPRGVSQRVVDSDMSRNELVPTSCRVPRRKPYKLNSTMSNFQSCEHVSHITCITNLRSSVTINAVTQTCMFRGDSRKLKNAFLKQ